MDKKKLIKYGIFAVIGIVIAILFLKSCSLYDANSLLKGRYDTLQNIFNEDHDRLTKKNAEIIADNQKLVKENVSLVNTVGQLTNDIGQARGGEVAAKAESNKLKAEVQPAIDANPKLKKFVEGLEMRLVQKDGIIAKKDALILTLGVPTLEGFVNGVPVFSYPEGSITYNLNQLRIGEITIGENWKQDRDNEHTLRLLGEKRIGKLESSLRWTKFWKTGTTVLAIAGIGYAGYTLLRGRT